MKKILSYIMIFLQCNFCFGDGWDGGVNPETDPSSLHLDQSTAQSIIGGAPIFVLGLKLGDGNAYLSQDGSGNLTLTDTVTGTKTLAQLVSASTYIIAGQNIDVSASTGDVTISVEDLTHSDIKDWNISVTTVGDTYYVPYTGSTGTVDLGDQNLTTTGTLIGKNVTSGHNPGHTHDDQGVSMKHNKLANLNSDDHLHYLNINGRATGQTIIGGTGSSENLYFQTTNTTIRGSYYFKDLTSNGFVRTDGGNGKLTIDTNTYMTAAIKSINGMQNVTQTIVAGSNVTVTSLNGTTTISASGAGGAVTSIVEGHAIDVSAATGDVTISVIDADITLTSEQISNFDEAVTTAIAIEDAYLKNTGDTGIGDYYITGLLDITGTVNLNPTGTADVGTPDINSYPIMLYGSAYDGVSESKPYTKIEAQGDGHATGFVFGNFRFTGTNDLGGSLTEYSVLWTIWQAGLNMIHDYEGYAPTSAGCYNFYTTQDMSSGYLFTLGDNYNYATGVPDFKFTVEYDGTVSANAYTATGTVTAAEFDGGLLDISGNGDIDGHVSIGNNAGTSSDIALWASESYTGGAGDNIAAQINVAQYSGTPHSVIGLNATNYIGGTADPDMAYGMYFEMQHDNANTLNDGRGVNFQYYNTSGITTNAYGSYFGCTNISGTIDTGYGGRFVADGATSQYGVYSEALGTSNYAYAGYFSSQSATGTNNYGIYSIAQNGLTYSTSGRFEKSYVHVGDSGTASNTGDGWVFAEAGFETDGATYSNDYSQRF